MSDTVHLTPLPAGEHRERERQWKMRRWQEGTCFTARPRACSTTAVIVLKSVGCYTKGCDGGRGRAPKPENTPICCSPSHLHAPVRTCLHLRAPACTCLHLRALSAPAHTCLHLPALAHTCLHLPTPVCTCNSRCTQRHLCFGCYMREAVYHCRSCKRNSLLPTFLIYLPNGLTPFIAVVFFFKRELCISSFAAV